jgi:hypothetical protein
MNGHCVLHKGKLLCTVMHAQYTDMITSASQKLVVLLLLHLLTKPHVLTLLLLLLLVLVLLSHSVNQI